jgi:16S rRNA G966 N2-methylase RsmD
MSIQKSNNIETTHMINTNVIHKIFPQVKNQELLKYDAEGLWSITLPTEAEQITNIIKTNITQTNHIFDGTGGLGGNIISFSKYFKNVTTCEINNDRFLLLKNNIDIYKLNNIKLINDSCTKYINDNYDAYFFDPPWSKNYKNYNKLNLKLDNFLLKDIIKQIRSHNNSPIFFKLPFNYDMDEFKMFNYKLDKIKNYFLVTIS